MELLTFVLLDGENQMSAEQGEDTLPQKLLSYIGSGASDFS